MRIWYLALASAAALALAHSSSIAQTKGSFADDLEAARREYVMKSLAFSSADRDAALRYIDTARKDADGYSPQQKMAALMRIAAFAHNGHDWLKFGKGWAPDLRLPVRLLWLGDGLVVARTAPGYSRLLGARVTGIEGKGLEQLVAALRDFNGGNDQYIKATSPWQIQSPQLLNGMGIAARPDQLRLEVRLSNGKTEAVTLPAVPASALPPAREGVGSWSHALSDKERALGWQSAVKAAADPLYVQEPSRLYRMRELPELGALYVQFRGNYNTDTESAEEFGKRVHDRLATTTMRHVIVDERFNTGGNTDATMDLMREIGKHAKGQVYVIVGARTFSAGIASTALIKHQAPGRVVLVGEEIGDRLRWWSEGDSACLPNSGYCLAYTTGLWDLAKGCTGENGCYSERFDAGVVDLAPNIPVLLTAEDWINGRDPAMEAVALDLTRHK